MTKPVPSPDIRRTTGAADEPLAFLIGATAVGKSALALDVAERAGAAIVAMDSMQVYRGMDVGTAKPTAAERARVPHACLDLADPPERYDVQRYLADAEAALDEIRARGLRPLVVGGTGFYLKALVFGLFGGPAADLALRRSLQERARARGRSALHAELTVIDPAAAERIHPNDEKRVVRALEVWEQTGRTLSGWQAEWGWGGAAPPGRPRRIVGLRLEGAELDLRIGRRTTAMLDAGWAEEARCIRDEIGFGPTSVQALGYQEVLDLVDGKATRAEIEELVSLRTRRFARRQRTWFKKFPETVWVDADGPRAAQAVLEALGWATADASGS